jgi:hypothetical protein
VLLVAALLAGCSSSPVTDGGSDAGPPLPSPALSPIQACTDVTQALAMHEEACQRLDPSDEAAFIAARCPTNAYAQETAAYDAGLLAYSQSAVSCVVAFYRTLGCNFPSSTNSQCPSLGWGVAADGGTCGSPYACQRGFYCQRTSAEVCGACQPASAIGGPCGAMANGATCAVGQCNTISCTTVVSVGGMCEYGSYVCAPGLTCQITCQAPAQVGGGCGSDADCQDGLTCVSANTMPTCATRSALGQSCDHVACQLSLGCGALPDGGTSCQVLAAGGACVSVSDGGLCKQAEYCVDGGCVPQPVIGQTCSQDSDCAVGRCISKVCTLVPSGAACNGDTDCLSRRCNLAAATPTCLATCVN